VLVATFTVNTETPSTQWYEAADDLQKRKEYIHLLSDQIVARFHPKKIILFGSHAWGQPTTDSDIDLLVVMPHEGRHTTQAIQIVNGLNTLAPIDLLVRTPEEVQERLEIGDSFLREIVERGKVMYEADHSGVD
jgi:predicted nucleotidyltransferase